MNCRLIEYTNELLTNAGITQDDSSRVQTCIEAATRAIRTYCRRKFFLQTHDELHLTSQFGFVVIRERPLVSIARIMDTKKPWLQLTYTGGTSGTYTTDALGINLTGVSAGVVTVTTLAFENYATLSALATAISNLSGWSCTVISPYSSFPSSDLVTGQYGNCCPSIATVSGWIDSTKDLPIDWVNGFIGRTQDFLLGVYNPNTFITGVAGGTFQPDSQVRIVYVGGYDCIPADLQRVCAELVGNMLDPRYAQTTNESLGGYAYGLAADEALGRLPIKTKHILESYKERRWCQV